MAFIDHRCTTCRHPKSNNTGGCNNGFCPCACTYGPPEVITTYTLAGQPITCLTAAPGQPLPYKNSSVRTCDCPDCHDLHTRVTSGGAAS